MADPLEKVIRSKPVTWWRSQIAAADELRRRYEPWWDRNLQAYCPTVGSTSPDRYGDQINTNRDFTLVERKKADLFYQRPDVTLQPTPLLEAIPQAAAGIQAHEEIVNEKLGPDGIDATRLVHRAIFDVLNTQGIGATVMGYEQVTVIVPQEVQVGEAPNPGSILGLGPATPIMKKIDVPVPMHQHCFWSHVPGKKLVIPADFRSTDWDRAPFLGFKLELPLTTANRQKYQLPEDFQGTKSDGSQYYDHGGQVSTTTDVFTGTELWYKSSLFREDVVNPDHLTHLVLIDGLEEPALEEDCPYQTLDEKGQLTPDSLIGFPVHILNVREVPDSSYPPSDSTMIRPLVNELNVYRTQQVQFRDAATLKWIYNVDALPSESVAKIVRAPIGGLIGVPSEAMSENVIKELPQGTMPRENFAGQQAIDDDIARTIAIDASGAGVQSQNTSTTATEQQIVAANANARLDFERGVTLAWYVKGVTKFSTLLQRYLPIEDAAKIVGPQRAQMWEQWRKVVPSALSFTALPDSALRVDQAVDRKQAQDLYTYLANDPHVNRQALLRKLLRKFHLNPDEIVQQPPPPQPDPTKLAMSAKGEDLMAPQAPIILEMLMQAGWKISPGAVQMSQAFLQNQLQLAAEAQMNENAGDGGDKHGGKVAQMEGLDKHAVDQTGGMQNTGAPAALGQGGGYLQ